MKGKIGEIVWLEDPLKFTYLREKRWDKFKNYFSIKEAKTLDDFAKIIGYEYLGLDSRGFLHNFRMWWLKKHDRDISPNGVYKNGCPAEAVIPSSIVVGKKSIDFHTTFIKKVKNND